MPRFALSKEAIVADCAKPVGRGADWRREAERARRHNRQVRATLSRRARQMVVKAYQNDWRDEIFELARARRRAGLRACQERCLARRNVEARRRR